MPALRRYKALPQSMEYGVCSMAADSHRSGMCKAGFAGDDAPRAVFRRLAPQLWPKSLAIASVIYRTELTMYSFYCWPAPPPWVSS